MTNSGHRFTCCAWTKPQFSFSHISREFSIADAYLFGRCHWFSFISNTHSYFTRKMFQSKLNFQIDIKRRLNLRCPSHCVCPYWGRRVMESSRCGAIFVLIFRTRWAHPWWQRRQQRRRYRSNVFEWFTSKTVGAYANENKIDSVAVFIWTRANRPASFVCVRYVWTQLILGYHPNRFHEYFRLLNIIAEHHRPLCRCADSHFTITITIVRLVRDLQSNSRNWKQMSSGERHLNVMWHMRYAHFFLVKIFRWRWLRSVPSQR